MSWLNKRTPFMIASAFLGFLLFIFLVVPLIVSVNDSTINFVTVLKDQRTHDAFVTSFLGATLATVYILLLGVPLAYVLIKFNFPGKKLTEVLIDIPMLIPHNAAGIALLTILSPRALIGGIASEMGINFVDTIWGVIAAMIFVSAPYMIRSVQDAFSSVNPDIEKVAKSLGASDWQLFTYIYLPLAFKGIITGCILTWARALSEFGAVVVLAYYPKTVPVLLMDVLISEGLYWALPINAVLILLAIIILFIFKSTTNQRRWN
ncbi:ABC transporter permease [Candidatus Bathyarchaeota archaeon]|nr:ABC transporter permease [Candidatus Bathyarchaeota archaeon]